MNEPKLKWWTQAPGGDFIAHSYYEPFILYVYTDFTWDIRVPLSGVIRRGGPCDSLESAALMAEFQLKEWLEGMAAGL
jgi:hypothetical protein